MWCSINCFSLRCRFGVNGENFSRRKLYARKRMVLMNFFYTVFKFLIFLLMFSLYSHYYVSIHSFSFYAFCSFLLLITTCQTPQCSL
jgi:hypothetical protein